MGRVSVIIPTWNREKLVVRAVQSALAQTSPPMEILVCDDGSSDGTVDAIRALASPTVKLIGGDHSGGPAVPRNRGLRASNGNWLAFLDSDDEWLPDKLEKQLCKAASLSSMAICTDSWRIRAGATESEPMLGGSNAKISFNDLLQVNRVICSSMMVQREIIDLTSGFPEDPELVAIEDYALWLRVADLTDIAYLSSPLLNYTDEPASSLRSKDRPFCEQRQLVMGSFIDWKGQRGKCSANYWKVRFRLLLDSFSVATRWKY